MSPFDVIVLRQKPIETWTSTNGIRFAMYRTALVTTIDGISVVIIPGCYNKRDHKIIQRMTPGNLINWLEIMVQRPGSIEIDFTHPDSIQKFDDTMRDCRLMGSVRPARG